MRRDTRPRHGLHPLALSGAPVAARILPRAAPLKPRPNPRRRRCTQATALGPSDSASPSRSTGVIRRLSDYDGDNNWRQGAMGAARQQRSSVNTRRDLAATSGQGLPVRRSPKRLRSSESLEEARLEEELREARRAERAAGRARR